jgi:hypothetical protein
MGINFKSSLDRQVQHRAFLMRQRNIIIASVVVMLHLFAVWALQSGLLMRAVEVVVPVEFLAQMIEPPKPAAPPPPPIAPKETPISVKQTVVKPTATVSNVGCTANIDGRNIHTRPKCPSTSASRLSNANIATVCAGCSCYVVSAYSCCAGKSCFTEQ